MFISNEKEIINLAIKQVLKDNTENLENSLRNFINQKADISELAKTLYFMDMNLEEYIDYLYKKIIEGKIWKRLLFGF